jgi:dipicolinate synthase subunit B
MSALAGKRVGVAMTGSFCTFERAFAAFEELRREGAELVPVMSETAYFTDTRFGAAADMRARLVEICGMEPMHTIAEVEPIGPKGVLDVLLVAPCTGNTLSKLALGITDTCVTMACKSHLRNERPVVVAVSSNDVLTGSMPAFARLSGRKFVFFVPVIQDDPVRKPGSCVFCVKQVVETVAMALEGKQIRPIFRERTL